LEAFLRLPLLQRIRRLTATVLLFSQLCLVTAAAPVEWRPVVFLDNEIYPSYLVAIANLGRNDAEEANVFGYRDGVVGVYVKSPRDDSQVRLTLKIDEVADEQTFTYLLPNQGQVYLLLPYVAWNWKALRNSRQARPANCHFTLAVNDSPPENYNQVVTVRSINEALLGFESEYPGEERSWVPTNFVLASYVNEDHPWIDQVLREALDTGIVSSFDGYQSGDTNQVLGQIWSIWYTLQRRGFRYSSISQSASGGDKTFDQHVRLFQESITTAQANCVDGTVMLASILRKIGIESGIVTVPGHCFLVFRLAPDARQSGLETTMIGAVDLSDSPPTSDPNDPGRQASLQNFLAAVTSGTDEFGQNLSKIVNSESPAYSLTMIKDAREMFKIYPLVVD
jgi:hypothetical protein